MITATPNIRSICKIITDSKSIFAGQVIVSDTGANCRNTYAVRLLNTEKNKLILDKGSIYKFIGNGWEATTLSDHICDVMQMAIEPIIRSYAHLFVKDISKDRNGTKLSIWEDTVIKSAAKCTDSHCIKIGDKIFDTHSASDMTDPHYSRDYITYTVIADASRSTYKLFLADEPNMVGRLTKQFKIAERQYKRMINSRPCGGISWAAAQNARKEFGQSNRNHRELRRDRA